MKRLRTTVLVLSLVFFLMVFTSQTAHAQSLRLRLWSTPRGTSVIANGPEPDGAAARRIETQGILDSLVPGNIVWDSTLFGFEVRTAPRSRFLFSLAADTGSMANLIDGEGGFGSSPGTNRFLSANVHYVLPLSGLAGQFQGAQATVFAGYGYGGLEVDVGGGTRRFDARGLRYGLDLTLPFGSDAQWYLFGSAAFGNWGIAHTVLGVPDPPDGTARITDLNFVLGRWLTPTVAGEIGWRSINWNTTAVGLTPCPCSVSWSGWTATVNFRLR